MTSLTVHRSTLALAAREKWLAAAMAVLALAACLVPALHAAGWATEHYVDTRAWLGLPNGADVLSNLPFLFMGAWGLGLVRGRRDVPVGTHWFFWGLILTCVGSSYFHLQPDALRLVGDRAGMAVAFAGLLGIAAGERISERAGHAVMIVVTVAGLLAAWIARENLTPWAVVQFGGMAMVVVLAFVRPRSGTLGVRLGGVIAFYALAKLAELGDAAVFEFTHHLVSGHTLKHLLAAMAAWPVIWALGHNAPNTPR